MSSEPMPAHREILLHIWAYGAFAAMLLAVGHGRSIGATVFFGAGSWGSVVYIALARLLP